eukprot:IDg2027t1
MDDAFWWQEVAQNDDFDIISSMLECSSDVEAKPRYWGGSVPGRARNLNRRAEAANKRLQMQYFAPYPLFDDSTFQRRFRMSRKVFLRVFTAIAAHDDIFRQRKDCTGRLGLNLHQKIIAAFRMIAYRIAADFVDEILGMSESTTLECLDNVVKAINACFGAEYLREPTEDDIRRLLRHSAAR